MRTIALEEHFVTQSFLKATTSSAASSSIAHVEPKLLDLGAGRIAAMDEAAIDYQVLSLAAMGIDALKAEDATDLLHDINDELADAVKANPQTPRRLCRSRASGSAEIGRRARTMRAAIRLLRPDGQRHHRRTVPRRPRFLPVWEAAASLKVPV